MKDPGTAQRVHSTCLVCPTLAGFPRDAIESHITVLRITARTAKDSTHTDCPVRPEISI